MIEVQLRFLALFAVVSGLAALAAAVLISGAGRGQGLLIGTGGAVAVLALLGIVVLARLVIVAEREARR